MSTLRRRVKALAVWAVAIFEVLDEKDSDETVSPRRAIVTSFAAQTKPS